MKFGEVIKMAKMDLYISKRHDEWMAANPNPVYNQRALDLLRQEVTKTQRVRTGTVSASSLGSCLRRQQFTFLGMPELPPNAKTAGIFHNGTFMHLRWQMAGLTAGWLADAEVPVRDNKHRMSGTADGLVDDDSLLELKSINDNGFRGVVTFGAKEDHQFQLASYLVTSGRTMGRFVYENKNTQEYIEIPYELTTDAAQQFESRADYAWSKIDAQELAEPLDKCMAGEGYQYKFCPFRDRCMSVHSWSETQQLLG